MKKHLWLIVPILAALVLAVWFEIKASASRLDIASTIWDARTFTRYNMEVNYSSRDGVCIQVLTVEGDYVILARKSSTCTKPPFADIEYPTVNDIFDYLQMTEDYFEAEHICGPIGCDCSGPMGVAGVYAPTGYPLQAVIRPIYEVRDSYANPLDLSVPCAAYGYVADMIHIVSLIPQ